MIRFIKEHRDVCGVEPICRVLQVRVQQSVGQLIFGFDGGSDFECQGHQKSIS